jgi:hypothetical protein
MMMMMMMIMMMRMRMMVMMMIGIEELMKSVMLWAFSHRYGAARQGQGPGCHCSLPVAGQERSVTAAEMTYPRKFFAKSKSKCTASGRLDVNARFHVADEKDWFYATCPKPDCRNHDKLFPREAQLTGSNYCVRGRTSIPCTHEHYGNPSEKYTPYKENGKMKEVPQEHRQRARKSDGNGNRFGRISPSPFPSDESSRVRPH